MTYDLSKILEKHLREIKVSNIFGGTCYGKCVVSCQGCISANIKQIQKLCHILYRTPFRLNYSCKKLHLRYDGKFASEVFQIFGVKYNLANN